MFKWVLLLIGFWWLARVVRQAAHRILTGGRDSAPAAQNFARRPQPEEELSDLTQQKISDADYEEIP